MVRGHVSALQAAGASELARRCLLALILVACLPASLPAYGSAGDGGAVGHTGVRGGSMYGALRLRGGKGPGRRTQPVPQKNPKFFKKHHSATWDKLKVRTEFTHPKFGRTGNPSQKAEPGNPWATGGEAIDFAEGMTLGKDLPYGYAHLKGSMLFHPDTMEKTNLERIFLADETDEWQEWRWDPRDIDENVRKAMEHPTKYHPVGIHARAIIEESEASRAVASRVGLKWLLRNTPPPAERMQQSGLVEVPGKTCAGVAAAFMPFLGGEGGARSEEEEGALVVKMAAGVHAWSNENPAGVLGVVTGAFDVARGTMAPGGEESEDVSDVEVGGGEMRSKVGAGPEGSTELVGCWWVGDGTRGRFSDVRLVQNQTREFQVPGLGEHLATLGNPMNLGDAEEGESGDGEGGEDGEGGWDDSQDPLSVLTVMGCWELEACDIAGGFREVLSVRARGDCAVSSCRIRDVPLLGEDCPFKNPYWQYNDSMYNRTLDMEGVGKMTDGIQCFDESRIRLRATLFADSLHGGVRLFNKAEGVISNCTFANFEVGVEGVDSSRVAIDSCAFLWSAGALLTRGEATGLLEDCKVVRNVVGVSVHGATDTCVRRCTFRDCHDGALFSGGEAAQQRLRFVDNHVSCLPDPDTEAGFTWLSLQRPGKLVEENNVVKNDPVYPATHDIAKKYSYPESWDWERINKDFWDQYEKHHGPMPYEESYLSRYLQLAERKKHAKKVKERADQIKADERRKMPAPEITTRDFGPILAG